MNDIKNDTHEIVNMWTAMNQENHWRIEEIAELKKLIGIIVDSQGGEIVIHGVDKLRAQNIGYEITRNEKDKSITIRSI